MSETQKHVEMTYPENALHEICESITNVLGNTPCEVHAKGVCENLSDLFEELGHDNLACIADQYEINMHGRFNVLCDECREFLGDDILLCD